MSIGNYIFGKLKSTFVHNQKMQQRMFLSICLSGILILMPVVFFGQEKPPKPITVTVETLNSLEFGTFIAGTGTVKVDYNNFRTSFDIILPTISKSTSPRAAAFLVTANIGTLINISTNTPQYLTGGSPSSTMQLNINLATDCNKGSSFIANSAETYVYIGGTLTVNSSNIAGIYGGCSFTVTFNQQ